MGRKGVHAFIVPDVDLTLDDDDEELVPVPVPVPDSAPTNITTPSWSKPANVGKQKAKVLSVPESKILDLTLSDSDEEAEDRVSDIVRNCIAPFKQASAALALAPASAPARTSTAQVVPPQSSPQSSPVRTKRPTAGLWRARPSDLASRRWAAPLKESNGAHGPSHDGEKRAAVERWRQFDARMLELSDDEGNGGDEVR